MQLFVPMRQADLMLISQLSSFDWRWDGSHAKRPIAISFNA